MEGMRKNSLLNDKDNAFVRYYIKPRCPLICHLYWLVKAYSFHKSENFPNCMRIAASITSILSLRFTYCIVSIDFRLDCDLLVIDPAVTINCAFILFARLRISVIYD
jgi:hypothetical protein